MLQNICRVALRYWEVFISSFGRAFLSGGAAVTLQVGGRGVEALIAWFWRRNGEWGCLLAWAVIGSCTSQSNDLETGRRRNKCYGESWILRPYKLRASWRESGKSVIVYYLVSGAFRDGSLIRNRSLRTSHLSKLPNDRRSEDLLVWLPWES